MFADYWSRLGAFDPTSARSRERFALRYRRWLESIRPRSGATVDYGGSSREERFPNLYAQDARRRVDADKAA